MYYKYKKMEQDGVKFRKPQKEIYDGMKARIQRESETVDVRDGTAYFEQSHLSSAKGLGGVNDQFMMNKKGDFVHFINDENDLFGQTVPGDSRVLSVTSPNGYNMFVASRKAPTSKPSPAKKTFQRELQEMGAEPVNAQPKGMLEQAAVGLHVYDNAYICIYMMYVYIHEQAGGQSSLVQAAVGFVGRQMIDACAPPKIMHDQEGRQPRQHPEYANIDTLDLPLAGASSSR